MPLGAFKAALMGTAGVSAAGDVVLLSTQTASDSSSLDFTSGITSTYGEYIFKFYNINPATNSATFKFQAGSSYNETITSTSFYAEHNEADSVTGLAYDTGFDQAQGTAFQDITANIGNGADEAAAGTLHLFNPSSTTYVKHWYARTNCYYIDDRSVELDTAGYFNTTSALTQVQFKMATGNFDGKIKMWGVK